MNHNEISLVTVGSILVLTGLLLSLSANGNCGYYWEAEVDIHDCNKTIQWRANLWTFCDDDGCFLTKLDAPTTIQAARGFYVLGHAVSLLTLLGFIASLFRTETCAKVVVVFSTLNVLTLIVADFLQILAYYSDGWTIFFENEEFPENADRGVCWGSVVPIMGLGPEIMAVPVAVLLYLRKKEQPYQTL